MSKNDGGPAFPRGEYSRGMSLRDWFAGQVLTGFFADRGLAYFSEDDRTKLAATAYELADAMLAERDRQP